MLQFGLEEEQKEAYDREACSLEYPAGDGEIQVPRQKGGSMEANNHQREAKCPRLFGPEQHQIKCDAKDNEIDDILPTKPMYEEHDPHGL